MADPYPQIPCGRCKVGIYAEPGIEAGQRLFSECQTRRDALRVAPRCESDPGRICMGARDFIVFKAFRARD